MAAGVAQVNQSSRTVTLDGGRITLEIPAGAAAEGISVSLKKSTARFPDTGAVLKSFQLLPEGTVFKKPVTLTIKYDEQLLNGNSPSNIGIAFRNDADGSWYAPLNGSIDTLNKTISLKIMHFSQWSIFSCFHLYVKVNNKVYRDEAVTIPMLTSQRADLLLVMDLPPLSNDEYIRKLLARQGEKLKKDPVRPISTPGCPDCDLLAPVHYNPIKFDDIQSKSIKPDEWRVNGVKGGSEQAGKITHFNNNNFKYTAPLKMPVGNPMAVTAVINTPSHRQLQVIRHVNVYARKCHLDYSKVYEDRCEGDDDFGYGYKAALGYQLDFTLREGFEIANVGYHTSPLKLISYGNCTACESDVRLSPLENTGIIVSNIKTSILPGKNNPFPFQIIVNGSAKVYGGFYANWMANVCGDDPFPEKKNVVLDDYKVEDFPLGWLPATPQKTDIRLGDDDPSITATMEASE